MKKSLLLVSVGLLACGSSDNGGGGLGECPSLQPCGGTIVPGTYTISSLCGLNSALTVPSSTTCSGETITPGSTAISGSMTFADGGRYTVAGTMSAGMTMHMPASCLGSGTVKLTCSQMDALMKQGLAQSGGDVPIPMTMSCSGSNDCDCAIKMNGVPLAATGTYSTSGTQITITQSDASSGTTSSYCVSGNQIVIKPNATTTSSSTTNLTGAATLVLTRQ